MLKQINYIHIWLVDWLMKLSEELHRNVEIKLENCCCLCDKLLFERSGLFLWNLCPLDGARDKIWTKNCVSWSDSNHYRNVPKKTVLLEQNSCQNSFIMAPINWWRWSEIILKKPHFWSNCWRHSYNALKTVIYCW